MLSGRTLSSLILLVSTAVVTAGCPDPNPEGPTSVSTIDGAPGIATTDKGATQPNAARWKVAGTDGVKLSGTFEYAGTKTGRHRIDFLTVADNGPPRLSHTVELKKPGEWSVTAPRDAGQVMLMAFIDQAGDGPGGDDPAGTTAEPLVVGQEPIPDIKVVLTDDADLSALNLGGGSPGASAPPMDETAPGTPPEGTEEGAMGPPPGSPGGPPVLPEGEAQPVQGDAPPPPADAPPAPAG